MRVVPRVIVATMIFCGALLLTPGSATATDQQHCNNKACSGGSCIPVENGPTTHCIQVTEPEPGQAGTCVWDNCED